MPIKYLLMHFFSPLFLQEHWSFYCWVWCWIQVLILLLEPLVCVQLCFGGDHKAFGVWFTAAAKLAHPFLGSPELKIQSPLKTALHTAGCNSAHSFCRLNSQRSIYRGKPPANWCQVVALASWGGGWQIRVAWNKSGDNAVPQNGARCLLSAGI